MLKRRQTEVRAACALVSALDEHEITLGEFAEEVSRLTSEAVFVIATALRACGGPDETGLERLRAAYLICNQIAHRSRVLS